MTTITINRATVEQALEAIEDLRGYRKDIDEAIVALRAALAEQRLTDVQREMERSIESLKAALAQQAAPERHIGLSIKAQSTIGRWLNEDMDRAVVNGANSISMPDELVEIATWLDALTMAQQAEPVEPQPTTSMAEIERLRAERDALADRLLEVRALLTDTTDAHRRKVVMNAWAEARLARHGIPMPEGDPK